MSINIDKVIESIPNNLIFVTDPRELTAKRNLSSNTVWGPFEVEKFHLESQTQIREKIRIINAEWVNFLIENLHTSDHDEGNVTLIFAKKDFQVILSTNDEIEVGRKLNCNLSIVEQLPTKAQKHTDSSIDCDQSNEKLSKTCKFCGINFSHQCTLDAHMTYYCSKRQNVLPESNPSLKCQKTWRTRQRNKQISSQKINSSDTSSFNSNRFDNDETTQFQINDRNVCSKFLLNSINGSESLLNLTHQAVLKKPALTNSLLTNGNVVSVKSVEPERGCNQPIGNNSDSESENGSMNTLGFCAPCGLFFSSKELYNIHIQLDINNFQTSIVKCNSLVLAAPVFNNNGLQYVPIHPRTSLINSSINSHQQKAPTHVVQDTTSSSVPLDLSVNNSSKSPTHGQNDRVSIEVSDRVVPVPGTVSSNCNNIPRTTNKRPFLCQHCQTRFQLYTTFQAHQEFYCQGKRQPIEIMEKRCRTSSAISGHNDIQTSVLRNDDVSWKFCNQGFKCEGCGFIGQTKRGIRIHCKNQCFKRLQDRRSEARCDDVEISSPTSDVWANNNNTNNTNNNSAASTVVVVEPSELFHQDSPMKIESV